MNQTLNKCVNKLFKQRHLILFDQLPNKFINSYSNEIDVNKLDLYSVDCSADYHH